MGRYSRYPRQHGRTAFLETLESRDLMAADPLPVLMVLADRQDFYYREYGETRIGLEAAGVAVRVAAMTTNPTFPHPGTGETGSGMVVPDLALASVDPADYSAIVFVGGWGSSMYQYAYPGDYVNNAYDGDPATKAVVNELIGEFLAQDKYVAAICHGVTVLAWARVDGVSPLSGKTVSVPWIGSPATFYQGQWYGGSQLMQYPQVTANGAMANTHSGQYGNPATVADDVVVDGRIITAENFDAALYFGSVIATHVIAAAEVEEPPPPPPNQPPTIGANEFELAENASLGAIVGSASATDPDAGQSLTYAIVGGNTGGAFAINPATGQISVAIHAALDFETTPAFSLTVEATDDGQPALAASAVITIQLLDQVESLPPGAQRIDNDLVVQGTAANDTIYVWTSHTGQLFAWLNGQMFGPHLLPAGGRAIVHAGDGNDQVYATDSARAVSIYGEGGHDQMTGGSAGDRLDGGDGVDRIWGQAGDDLILGGEGSDFIDGREGNDVVLGGAGDDNVGGFDGRDLLIGGLGYDRADGGAGADLMIAGRTSYDENDAALLAILAEWTSAADAATRTANLTSGIAGNVRLRWGDTVHDDGIADCLNGAAGADWLFMLAVDCQYWLTQEDRVTNS
jgi:putative intracellular protease/amidase